ncbi:group II intron reverse transcriptase/maturase [Sorangium sp. So ce302]|uniref:group II intron reverse transcriptase/maturase n=1 Tax=Sorangium sp. So ce302 TaxID=3133297 RepID=UPI003F609390
MGETRMAPEKAVYAAPQSDQDWLRSVQRELHRRSRDDLDYVFRKLWGFIVDPRTLRCAFHRVARNRGSRTAGVDGVTVVKLGRTSGGSDSFVQALREELKTHRFRPSPVRRVLIPKAGAPGKYRALGIPTVKDRVVQAALKSILEPIFEADFFPVSYGFRPGRGVHGALEHLRVLLRPRPVRKGGIEHRLPYQWAIEGDIKGCFDHIGHHALMNRVRRRIGDAKVTRLIAAFLKAGVLSEDQFSRTEAGTPQGGILSPLLANIALSAIEERYERHVWPRRTPTIQTDPAGITRRANERRATDRRRGLPILVPIRYADDFIILVAAPTGPQQHAEAERVANEEKAALASFLKAELGLELAEAKTLVTPVTKPMSFLGHHVLVRRHPGHGRQVSAGLVPKERSQRLREKIKQLFKKRSTGSSLRGQLQRLNPILRGWANFYRHAWGAKKVFNFLDHYVWWTIARWLRKKHRISLKRLILRYGQRRPRGRGVRWTDGGVSPFETSTVRVEQYKLGWMREPYFATNMERKPGA